MYQRSTDPPTRLFMPGWNPGQVNGGSSSRAWGKSNENHVPQEPGACWDSNGDSVPMAHQRYSAEEREVCTSHHYYLSLLLVAHY